MEGAETSTATGVRVLMLSGEQLLLRQTASSFNDAQQRHVAMAKAVQSLDILVFSRSPHATSRFALNRNLWVHPVAGRNLLAGSFSLVRKASLIVKKQKVDLVTTEDPFMFGMIGLLLKIRYGIAFNAQLHADVIGNPYWVRRRPFLRRALGALARVVLHGADSIRVVSTKVEDVVRAICGPSKPLYLIPTGGGIELELFSGAERDDFRARFAQSDECLFLSVGRLAIEKDHDTLLAAIERAAPLAPSARFLIVGGGEEEVRLREDIVARGLSKMVSVVGHVSYEHLPSYFAAADVFVLTSLYEGMGRVLIEAAAARLPIISTDVGIARDVVENGRDGFVVPIEDPESLAGAIIILGRDSSLRESFKANAATRELNRFDRKFILDEIPRMWMETVGRQKNGS